MWMPPPLERNSVQVWQVQFAGDASLLDQCSKLLSDGECERAKHFKVRHSREQFVVGRGCLRILLGAAMGKLSTEIAFMVSEYGKLSVASEDGCSVFFNVAHTQETVLIALGWEGPLGVDVEAIQPGLDVIELARSSFSSEEIAQLAEYTDKDLQRRAFYRCWTQKEAVAKADGRGLSLPFASFNIPLRSEGSGRVRIESLFWAVSREYCLHELRMGETLCGAVVYEAPAKPVRFNRFPNSSDRGGGGVEF